MKTLSVKVSEPLAAKLAAMARKRRTTRSAIVREALEKYGGTRSFAEAAAEYHGAFSGPADLSTNPKHMKGFGK